jgi:RNA polymerase sigma-70 factor (ECF subfamily)
MEKIKLIIDGCLAKNPKYEKILFNLIQCNCMNICLRYFNDVDVAKDVFQEGTIKIFNQLDKFEYNGSFEGWIKCIMKNFSLDIIRRNKLVPTSIFNVDTYKSYNIIDEIEEYNEIRGVNEQDAIHAVTKLPNIQQKTFNLYVNEGLTHKEIGKRLGNSEATSKTNYRKARLNLIKQLI